MDFLKFIFYGIIQGLTEFIPVSSTAHLKIISQLFGVKDPGSSLSAIIQIGSVLAIFWYFRKYIFNTINSNSKILRPSFFSNKIYKSIFIGTIPIVLIGGIVKLFVTDFSNSFFRSNFSIAVVSILMSLIMFLADISTNKFINLSNHKYRNSLFIGISQAFAIIPGVSRSGATISMALLSGWDRKDAAKFSFLLGIPSISLAAFVEFITSINEFSTFPFLPLFVGLITTFFSSLLAIDFLLKYVSSNGLKIFIYYRLVFGILIILNL
ncbi:Bacitracin resistance protein BacA [Prochlorococcus marinus str. MIT 9515]|uniref:Undecaprenyl-diphosphatase n=1 Tax=Prochlorococcus marinus (strain MIT 9515) TaxID=167542 RepID=UPPP_PROM5|nr:undecaprenyl-diphosphate phosphatase [Prochlorococcus marinus]A2BWT5.1 RecName: Full=Undecaprenyl-diphosphatase; AltName: Full=Bacitracin resistance protein; AltName: Full=Undecaprenyl pyrophosphate phosphatase [Prochlorococcus marinus str. MIT 9515]ABM72246.1 Bacitracin resistance protein BacA [Prochlorococcus marinus str. MIT 9515]